MSDTPIVSPLNDFGRIINIQTRGSDGVLAALTTGTVTGFIANSNAGDAAAYDAGWSVSGTYVGANGGDLVAGDWFFSIDAAVLTVALCRAAFGNGETPYFIAQRTNGFRRYVKCKYSEADKADAA